MQQKKIQEMHDRLEASCCQGEIIHDDFLDAIRYCYQDMLDANRYRPISSNNQIVKVIFNDPATIVFWVDGTKTVVKRSEDDVWDPEKGLAMAIVKRFFGYTSWIKNFTQDDKEEEITLEGINNGLSKLAKRFADLGKVNKKKEE